VSSSPTLAQVHFRVRTDTATVDTASPTWAAAEDTSVSLAVETTFRIRFVVQNTGTAASTSPTVLRVSKNGGAYTAVTTSSGATLGAQSDSGASSDADEAGINSANFRLTAGAGTANSGAYDETGSSTTAIGNGRYIEFEFGLILKTAGAAGGNTFDFRVYNNTTAFTTYTVTPRITCVDNNRACLANDVVSASSIIKPAVKQEHAILANDVTSPSSVSKPLLAIVVPNNALLANDVLSASSVGQPAATILRGLLANDVKSNSSVTQPTVKALHGLLANDVTSASSVGQPVLVVIAGQNALSANGVLSPSSVGQPAVHQVEGLLAENVTSASSVTTPTLVIPVAGVDALNANDLTSLSSVGRPALQQTEGLLAENVISASFVLPLPGLVEIASVEQALFADNVISASFVSQPMVNRPEIEVPELGGGGPGYGRGFPRKRWEELLAALEAERQAALERAKAFRGNKDRQRARKAARVASQAIAAALQAADEAAEVAHAGAITRNLEAATEAKGVAAYLKAMEAARAEAEDMQDEDDVETLLLVA
jgi:hypothetical protein